MLVDVAILLNRIAGGLARVVLEPIMRLPGWLSLSLIAAVTGVAMLWVFKHTSPQRTIKRVRDGMKANLLALSLFRDEIGVGLKCQGAIVRGAVHLLLLSLGPLLIMTAPMCLMLGQLGLWYQSRPLAVGEPAVVTVHFAADSPQLPEAELVPDVAIAVAVGPVRIPSRRMTCWSISAQAAGMHELRFRVAGQTVTKQLAVGSGFNSVSQRRPGRVLSDVLLHPAEEPFGTKSPVASIEVVFPGRESRIYGTDWWVVSWFVISLAAAIALKPLLKVNV